MKKLIATIVFSASILLANAQDVKQTFYANGAKESEGVLLCNDPRIFNKDFASLSKLEQDRISANSVKDGEWKYWFDNGQLRIVEYFNKGKKIKGCKTFYQSGKLESNLNFEGKTSFTYHENGQIETEGMFKEADLPDGIWKGYFENGKLNFESNYVNGTQHGITKWYDANGKLYMEQDYNNGQIIKENKY